MNFNILIKELGKNGITQISIFFMMSYFKLFSAFSSFASVYITYLPTYRCNVSPLDQYIQIESDILNLTTPFNLETNSYDGCYRFNYNLSNCNETLECVDTNAGIIPCDQGYTYDRSLFSETVVTEFGLVCDQYYLIPLSTSAYQLGYLLGSLFMSNIADRYGRKRTSLLMTIGSLICSFGIVYCSSVISFIIFRLISGVLLYTVSVAVFVYVLEIASVETRTVFGVGHQMFFSFGYIIETLVAYKYRNWRNIMLVCTFIASPFLLFISILPESPRWLFSVNRDDEAKKIIEKMAKINGKVIREEIWEKAAEADEDDNQKQKGGKYKEIDLFKRKSVRKVTLKLMYCWFAVVTIYYGLALNSGTLAGDIFVNNILSGLLEIIAYMASGALLERIGRRYTATCGYFSGSFLLVVSLILTELSKTHLYLQFPSTICAVIGRMGIVLCYGMIFNYTTELYPTVIRNTGAGLVSIIGRAGSVAAPYLISIQIYYRWLPNCIFAVIGFAAVFVILSLPETSGRNMLETIEEAEAVYTSSNLKDKSTEVENEEEKPIVKKKRSKNRIQTKKSVFVSQQ